MQMADPGLPGSVDLHARLTHQLQPRNDPSQAEGIASFPGNQELAGGSIFDAITGCFRIKFRCNSTAATYRASVRSDSTGG